MQLILAIIYRGAKVNSSKRSRGLNMFFLKGLSVCSIVYGVVVVHLVATSINQAKYFRDRFNEGEG